MLCADAEEQLALMLDPAPNDQAAWQLRTHLAGCIDCRKLIAHLILVRAVGRIARMQWGKIHVATALRYSSKSKTFEDFQILEGLCG